jgi:hypothetical protein
MKDTGAINLTTNFLRDLISGASFVGSMQKLFVPLPLSQTNFYDRLIDTLRFNSDNRAITVVGGILLQDTGLTLLGLAR